MFPSFLNRSRSLAMLFGGVALLSLAPSWAADDTAKPPLAEATPEKPAAAPAPQIDPKAQELREKMNAAYKKLNSLSVTMEAKAEPNNEGKTTLQFKKPKWAAVHTVDGDKEWNARSDGKQLYAFSSQDKLHYEKAPLPDSFEETLGRVMDAAGGGVGVMRLLLVGQDSLPPTVEKIALGEPGTVDGTPTETLQAWFPGPQSQKIKMTYALSKEDHLLRQVTLEVEGKGKVFTETYTNLKLNPDLPDSVFAFTPPAGAKPAEPGSETGDAGGYYDPKLKPGVAPYPFEVKDLEGKTASLDQFKGKVVLLDFWATWCGPCLEELPNVRAVYKQYQPKGFDVLGISIDQEKDQLTGFLKKNEMPWRQVFDLANKKDSVALKYSVQAIPFELLVGKDGKIVGVNLRGPQLEAAVKKAVAAK